METKDEFIASQNRCQHTNVETMINMFKGTAIDICIDCLKEFNVRDLTDEESEDFYADYYYTEEEGGYDGKDD